ncbi:predicted protein [Postia placenta Mad-698-R]|nr:predicted protein [Postia placenta Mad-698-R]
MTPAIPSLTIPRSELSQALFDELRTVVKGPVFRPSDPEFAERSRTFNGKLVCFSRALVSPLDAHDVSAIIRFCTEHGLSPSVKAAGYATAGWSVAGDVIIDLGMLRECDIEPPLSEAEAEAQGGKDWTRLSDMPPPGSKGKGRAGGRQGNKDGVVDVPSTTAAAEPASMAAKRPKVTTCRSWRQRSYDGASESLASFLRGPPLEPEEGEEPRKPPANRRRIDSAEDMSTPTASLDGEAHKAKVPRLGDSDDRTPSVSSGSMASTAPAVRAETSTSPAQAASSAQEPFGYMTSDAPSEPRAPMYSGSNPFATGPSSIIAPPGMLRGFPMMGSSSWTPPPSASLGSQGVRSAGVGPSMFSHTSFASGSMFPPAPSFMGMPMPMGMGMSSFGLPLGQMMPRMAPAQPVHKHAYITLGAGMRQKEVDMYTAEHPLEGISPVTGSREDGIVPYHFPSSAHPVGSSILLLAGFGFISRMHGLSIDNLVEVEMVMADGRIVVVNQDDDPDLWWAVRGAGPAFGIATRYKVRAFPVPVVFAGNLVYRFHRATAPSLIKHFRDCVKNAPRELYANVLLTAGPEDKDSLVVIQMCYVGPKEKGIEYLNAISSWDGERCLLNEVNEKSYLNQQDSVAQILRGKGTPWTLLRYSYSPVAGRQWFIRSSLIHSLPDEVVNKTVIQFANTPIGCTWLFELSGGAIGDFEDTCLPKEQRDATWTVAALHQWEMGIDDPRCITSAEDVRFCLPSSSWIDGVIGTVALGGPYPSFLARHEPPPRTMACFGKNWSRLAELKRRYDPQCLFKNNFWPVDAKGEPIELLSNEPPSPQ